MIRDTYVKSKKCGKPSRFGCILSFLDDNIEFLKNKINKPKIKKRSKNGEVLITLDMVQSLVKDKTDDDDDALVDATSDVISSIFKKSLEETINKFTEPNGSSVQHSQSSTFQQPIDVEDEDVAVVDSTAGDCSSIIISDVMSLQPKAISNTDLLNPELPAGSNTLKRNVYDSDNVNIESLNAKIPKTILTDPPMQRVDIPAFFKEIGEYVSTHFPLRKQMELRLKVLSLVTQTELELLHEKHE